MSESIDVKLDGIIDDIEKDVKMTDSMKRKIQDQNQNSQTSRGKVRHKSDSGEINKGLTLENLKNKSTLYKQISHTPNAQPIERVRGEIIEDNIEEFKQLYHDTCMSVLDEYRANNEELCKKHPYMWYKTLLLELKGRTPKVECTELDKLIVVWECLSELLYKIGLYPTYEIFQIFTKVYDYQLKNQAKVNPKYNDFLQKIYCERDNALVSEIATNPYNQTNKIFLAKVHGIIEKTEPKQIEVTHNVRNLDNLSRYRMDEIEEKQQKPHG